jgi:hypothetical protein
MEARVLLDPAIAAALRGALALLFGAAALHKLRGPAAFRAVLADYRVLPARLVPPAARLVPLAEGAAAAALLAAAGAAVGPALAVALLALYSAAIAVNLARGRRDLDCGCLGPALRQPLSGWLLARNALLASAALACLLPAAPRPFVWLDGVTAAAAAACLALFWSAGHRALANAPRLAALRVAP